MIVEAAVVEWDEDGAHLIVETGETTLDLRLADPEALYDAVRSGIGPWLYERDRARANRPKREEAYDLSESKHSRHHEVFADYATKEGVSA
jgi:hypothetical protein